MLVAGAFAYGYNFNYVIDEELAIGSIVGDLKKDFLQEHNKSNSLMTATDPLRFLFSPSSKNLNHFFHLDNTSGILSNKQIFDRETLCKPGGSIPSCRFTIDVQVTPKNYFTILKINVDVKDINDNPPKFHISEYNFDISDQTKVGHSFQLPTAQDDDSDEHGIEKYFIYEDESDPAFLDTFKLISRKMLDGSFDVRLEVKSKARLIEADCKSMSGKVVVVDKGNPPQSSVLPLTAVVSRTENGPKFEASLYRFAVAENAEVGTFVGQVRATSLSNASVQYYMQDHSNRFRKLPFRVHSKFGEIYVNGSVDYELEKKFKFNVVALSIVPPGSATATVEVTVTDINDCPPEIIINSLALNNRAQLKENSPEGTFISLVRVLDKHSGISGRSLCYAQSSYFALEAINSSTDAQEYKLLSVVSIDREELSKHDVQIVCEEFGKPGLISRKMAEVEILDENDNAPFFAQNTYVIDLHENTPPGSSPLLKLQASDVDEGQNAVLTYHLFPMDSNSFHSSLLFIDELDGGIYSRYMFDYERDPHRIFFLVKAIDSGETKLTGTTTLILNIVDVNDNAPRFTQQLFEYHVSRSELLEGTVIGIINSTDDDKSLANSRVTYIVDDSTQGSFFSIDPFSGELAWVKTPTDVSLYVFNITASNTFSKLVLNSSVEVRVYLDTAFKMFLANPPAKSDVHVFTGPIEKGISIFQIQVKNNHLMKPYFQLISGNDKNEFDVDRNSGVITAVKEIGIGLSFFNFTVLIVDENMKFERTVFHLPIFVNNTSDRHNLIQTWTRNPGNLAMVVCVAVALALVIVLLAIWSTNKFKCFACDKNSSKRLTKDLDGQQTFRVVPNFYESEPKIHDKEEAEKHNEVKFSLVNLEEMKDGTFYHNISNLYKVGPFINF